jgi:hypothetical protein
MKYLVILVKKLFKVIKHLGQTLNQDLKKIKKFKII